MLCVNIIYSLLLKLNNEGEKRRQRIKGKKRGAGQERGKEKERSKSRQEVRQKEASVRKGT